MGLKLFIFLDSLNSKFVNGESSDTHNKLTSRCFTMLHIVFTKNNTFNLYNDASLKCTSFIFNI